MFIYVKIRKICFRIIVEMFMCCIVSQWRMKFGSWASWRLLIFKTEFSVVLVVTWDIVEFCCLSIDLWGTYIWFNYLYRERFVYWFVCGSLKLGTFLSHFSFLASRIENVSVCFSYFLQVGTVFVVFHVSRLTIKFCQHFDIP